ncbi:MAG TPA: prepilin-type N-terminal cleavage/methylation domain-containing protein [Hyphomicrobiaceae bacterium]|nr:prepilin-type N-terminal cleavage/methylation domain-containing protein [Hyphomicrobiaceae bacterium]
MPRSDSPCSGFSLVEALVALAIAAVLTAALTRLIVATRVSAARTGEMTEMATLGETLMARVASSQSLRPGRTDGRRGAFAWHINVTPDSFTAVVRRKSEKKVAQSAAAEGGGAFAKAPAAPGASGTGAPAAPVQHWVTYRVAVVVEAPSGRTYAIDTIRIGLQAETDDR